jgi:hypothetical protein
MCVCVYVCTVYNTCVCYVCGPMYAWMHLRVYVYFFMCVYTHGWMWLGMYVFMYVMPVCI